MVVKYEPASPRIPQFLSALPVPPPRHLVPRPVFPRATMTSPVLPQPPPTILQCGRSRRSPTVPSHHRSKATGTSLQSHLLSCLLRVHAPSIFCSLHARILHPVRCLRALLLPLPNAHHACQQVGAFHQGVSNIRLKCSSTPSGWNESCLTQSPQ